MRLQQLNENDLSFVRSGVPERQMKWFNRGLDNLAKYKEAGEITKTELKDLKNDLSRGVEEAFKTLIREPYFYAGRWEDLPEDVRGVGDLNTGLHLAASSLKKAKKFPDHEVTRKVIQFFEELIDISEDVKSFKDKIVNRRQQKQEKKEEEKAATEKVYMKSADVQKVKRTLEQVTTQLRSDMLEDNTSWLTRTVTKWKKQYDPSNEKTQPREFYRHNTFSAHVIDKVTDRKGYSTNAEYTMKADYEKVIEEMAEEITNDMIEAFLGKNTAKLAEIVHKKGGLRTVTLKHADTRQGTIEGILRLEFDDGSGFTVNSKLVWSYSVHGKPFTRYPTTFHHVTLANGERMEGRASEERMKKEFAA